jgi:hypothetical protein
MKYLVMIFIIIIIIGLLANRELARDKKRIKRMIREYSFKTYSLKTQRKIILKKRQRRRKYEREVIEGGTRC